MKKKVTVLTIEGMDKKLFAGTFAGYIKTQREESNGIMSDYSGSIDEETGTFRFAKKSGRESKMNFESSVEGTFAPSDDGKSLVVEYWKNGSVLLYISFAVISFLFAAFLTLTLVQYYLDTEWVQTYFTYMFGFAFLILLPNVIFRFDLRALEKVLNKVVTAYAASLMRLQEEKNEGDSDDSVQ